MRGEEEKIEEEEEEEERVGERVEERAGKDIFFFGGEGSGEGGKCMWGSININGWGWLQ